MKLRDKAPNAQTATNMNGFGTTETGTTLENLKAAIAGETGASAKYAAYAKVAREEGYEQVARLFEAASAAEQVHIGLEYALVSARDADYVKPEPPEASPRTTDLNLIDGALGEIFETSDMYPAFIDVAEEEGDAKAVQVFTRAKLAESVHAELYLVAYNDLDAPDDDGYYLCPVCGFIHKGGDFERCPICMLPKEKFIAY